MKRATKPLIESVRIEHKADDNADTSYYGEFTDKESEDAFIRVGEYKGLTCREFYARRAKLIDEGETDLPSVPKGRELRFFLPAMTGEQAGNPESPKQDWQRMESLQRGDWHFIGIVAKAVIRMRPDGPSQVIRSGGLWGIESDSGKDCLAQTAKEQLQELDLELAALGLTTRQIKHAFSNVQTPD